MFCSNCGENIDPQAQVCVRCGTPLAGATQPSPPPAAVTQPNLPSLSPPPSAGTSAAPPPYVEPQTDGKAIFSLVLGILAIPLSITCILGLVAGIPAIILGHLSLSNIRKSMGRLKGEGMATAGLIMGYISIAAFPIMLIIAAIALPNLLKARMSANQAAAAAYVRTINTTQMTYSVTYPTQGYAPNLATLGPGPSGTCGTADSAHACLLDSTLGCSSETWCVKDAYKFSVVGIGSSVAKDFVVTATPVNSNAGNKSYCSTSDEIVRFRTGLVYAPITSVAECSAWDPI